MPNILLNAVFNPPLEIVHRSAQQLLIDSEHFLLDGILQLVQITGFVSVHTALPIPPAPHCAHNNERSSKHVPWAPHFAFWRCAMAPRSPDLSSCDFFLWGYLKGRVYTHKPRNLNELKDAIRQEVLTINQQLLARAMNDFKQRIENCIQDDGRHLNGIIFHTWIPNSNGMSWPLILLKYIHFKLKIYRVLFFWKPSDSRRSSCITCKNIVEPARPQMTV